MIDIHSHIIYGIDDGASDIEESMEIIRNLYKAGYTKVIATPHYIENTEYTANNKLKKERLNELRQRVKEENLNIELYLGNEIFLEEDIVGKILNQKVYSMNNNEYILVELPMDSENVNDLDILSDLIYIGAKVILAHPERYSIFLENPDKINKYIEEGVLLQGNIDALSGKYGKKTKKLFIKYLKERKYFAVGSDIHRGQSDYYKRVPSLTKEIIKLTNEDYLMDLVENNPRMILGSNSENYMSNYMQN